MPAQGNHRDIVVKRNARPNSFGFANNGLHNGLGFLPRLAPRADQIAQAPGTQQAVVPRAVIFDESIGVQEQKIVLSKIEALQFERQDFARSQTIAPPAQAPSHRTSPDGTAGDDFDQH